MAERYQAAWRVPSTTDAEEYGVLVRAGTERHPYWWLLCPAGATLYLEAIETGPGACSLGADCDWEDVHAAAARLAAEVEAA